MRKQKLKEISGIMKLLLSCRHLTHKAQLQGFFLKFTGVTTASKVTQISGAQFCNIIIYVSHCVYTTQSCSFNDLLGENRSQSSRPIQHGGSFSIKLGTAPAKFYSPENSKSKLKPLYPFLHLFSKGQGNLSSCCRREQRFLRGCKDKQAHTDICNPYLPYLGGSKPQGVNLVTKLVP